MEGYLKKWTNFMGGWKLRYLILENDILLTYYKEKVNNINVGWKKTWLNTCIIGIYIFI